MAGTDREYELSVTNHGPSDAQNVVVTDPLPASVSSNGTFTSVTPGWSCTTADQLVTCKLAGALAGPNGGVPVTARVRISIHISATHNVADPIVNTATVGSDTPDPGPTSNSDTDDSSVTGQADLTIEKTITTPAVAGRLMEYQLQVRNLGPSVATGPTTVTDTLPAGLTYDPDNPPTGTGWTCDLNADNTDLNCSYPATIGTAASGLQPAPAINAPVLVDQGTVGPVTNRATVSGPVFDPNPDNDTVTRPTPIEQLADVTITKTADPHAAVAGDADHPVTYQLAVVNKGPSTARLLSVVDTPQEGLIVTSLSGTGWACDLPSLTCTRDALAVGSSTITVTAYPEASVPTGSTLLNSADLTVGTPHSPGEPAWHGQDTITVDTLAGASLTKTHDDANDPVSAGDSVNFTLTASNAGPSDAVGPIRIVDTLPAGMSYLSNQGPWDCAAAGQVLTCELTTDAPRIPAGGAVPALDLTVSIDSAAPAGDLTNQAVVSTGTPQDPDVPTSATDTVPVTTAADLSIAKSHPVGVNAVAGRQFGWTLTVTNLGPSVSRASAADPITVTDTLPVGTTFVSGGNGEFSCAADDPGLVVCTRTVDLVVDAPPTTSSAVSFPITVAVAPSVRGQLTNNASVTPGMTVEPPGDVAAGNNTATDTVDVDTRADLTITKTHPDGSRAVAGTEFSWDIAVANAGPSDSFADTASPIVITDTLPAGVTFAGAVSDDFTCTAGTASGTVVCTATSSLAPGTHSIALTGLVRPDTLGDLTNNVEITASTTPDEAGDNTASDTVPLDTRADLAIVKTHMADAVAIPGEQFAWTLQVSNLGPSVSRGTIAAPITVTDNLPAGVTLVSATGDGWECTNAGQLVTCTLGSAATPADLPVGDAAPIAIVAAVDVGATGSLTNSATVNPGTTTDPDADDPTGNNTSTDTAVPVGPQADLSITKTHDPAQVRVGDPLSFTLTVANHGPSTAHDVRVIDTVPAGLLPVSADAPGWTCTIAGQSVMCVLDGTAGLLPLTVTGGAEQVIHVVTTVTKAAYPAVVNTASVSSATPDPDPKNATADDRVVVPAQSDLSLTKTLLGKLVVGRTGTYRLTLTNHGPTSLPTVATVVDQLPASLTAVSAKGVGVAATCRLGTTVTCSIPGPLAVGGTAVIELVVQVGPAAYPAVTNTASVTSTTPDSKPDNNSAMLTSPVTPTAGLTLTKTLQGGGPGPDGLLTWALTVNNAGPNATTAPITVTDKLPAGLSYRGFSTSEVDQWTCSATGPTVTCQFGGALAARASTGVLIRTALTAGPGVTLTNRAQLSSGDVRQSAEASYTAPAAPPAPPTTPPTALPTTPPATAPPVPPAAPGPNLPNTGFNVAPLLSTAMLLLAAGFVLAVAGRRRRHS